MEETSVQSKTQRVVIIGERCFLEYHRQKMCYGDILGVCSILGYNQLLQLNTNDEIIGCDHHILNQQTYKYVLSTYSERNADKF